MSRGENTRESRINTLKQTQEVRKQDSLVRVYNAIERLQKIRAKVNFQTIAKEANVSVSYLYKYPELKRHIAELRSQQNSMPVTPVAKLNSSATGKIITKLRERIQQLEAENSELKRKNEALAGQVYRVHYLTEQVERQQDTIKRLEACLKETSQPTFPAKVIPLATKSNAKISDRVLVQLKAAGIQLNPTLIKAIKSAQEDTVLNAIEAYKEALITGNVGRPGGWLKRAIEEEWKPNGAVQAKSELDTFNEWFPLAKNRGLVFASQSTKESIMLYTDEGEWIAFADMLTKYPIEKLKLSL
jgi:DNA repair exonuclease SbcCD ATPase subunit